MAEDCIINKLSWNISHYPNAASYIQPAFDDGDENDVHFVALPDEDWETIVFQEETVIKVLQLNTFVLYFIDVFKQTKRVQIRKKIIRYKQKTLHMINKW